MKYNKYLHIPIINSLHKIKTKNEYVYSTKIMMA